MRLPFISWSTAGVPSSQSLPGYLITAPPSVCVPDVLGAIAVWIQNQKIKYKMMCMMFYVFFIWLHLYAFAIHFMVHCGSAFEPGASGLPYYCTSICVRSWCNRRGSCVDSKTKTKKKSQPKTKNHQGGCYHGLAKGTLPEEYLKVTILTSTAWEDTRLIWCFSYPSRGAPLIPGRYVSW